MIDAVKSTLVSASVAPRVTEQSTAQKTQNSVRQVAEAGGQDSFYTSRNVRVDADLNVAVLEFRNPLNGDVKTQIPTEAQLLAYQIQEIQQPVVQQDSVA